MTAHTTGGEQDPPAEQPRTAAAALEQAVNPLQRLIRQRLRERGWSYGDAARRGGLPRSTVYTLATTRNLARPPRPATIDALAKGLDVPVSAVRAAAAESTGLHYYDEPPARPQDPGDRERELLIASIDELAPEDRRHVAALVESLRNRASPEPTDPLAPPGGARSLPGGAGRPASFPYGPRVRKRQAGNPAGSPSDPHREARSTGTRVAGARLCVTARRS
jgi:transcriptional regulator with XRE-family HTH domain